jgi:hypothetical protein
LLRQAQDKLFDSRRSLRITVSLRFDVLGELIYAIRQESAGADLK